jgi:hypothetical protein
MNVIVPNVEEDIPVTEEKANKTLRYKLVRIKQYKNIKERLE